jgi:hypothetical protein
MVILVLTLSDLEVELKSDCKGVQGLNGMRSEIKK